MWFTVQGGVGRPVFVGHLILLAWSLIFGHSSRVFWIVGFSRGWDLVLE